jgi:hypothetical protein
MNSDKFTGLADSGRARYESALLLDDDSFNANFTQRILESLGVQNLAMASDGRAGINIFDAVIVKNQRARGANFHWK